jgi:hypothetical protein
LLVNNKVRNLSKARSEENEMMNLGFIWFGEATYELSSGLKLEGFGEFLTYDLLWNNLSFGPLMHDPLKKHKLNC